MLSSKGFLVFRPPQLADMKDQSSSSTAKDRAASEDLSAKGGRFAIARQLGGALELGE
jgi:hypothetical protein